MSPLFIYLFIYFYYVAKGKREIEVGQYEKINNNLLGFIEWYDSPRMLFPSQSSKPRRSLLLMKTRSAEEFSPLRASANDTPSTSDFDSLWCPDTPAEVITPLENDGSAYDLFKDETPTAASSTTPHRRNPAVKSLLRRKRGQLDQLEGNGKKPSSSQVSMTMEEGLALGRASLAKLRQRLRSEGDVKENDNRENEVTRRTPLRPTLQPSPSFTPISSSTRTVGKTREVVITPSLVRSQQVPTTFATSTPKRPKTVTATSLKRYRTMNDSPTTNGGDPKRCKMARTQSLNATADNGSDDDSFLDDIFMPFTDPTQFTQMLNHGVVKR